MLVHVVAVFNGETRLGLVKAVAGFGNQCRLIGDVVVAVQVIQPLSQLLDQIAWVWTGHGSRGGGLGV